MTRLKLADLADQKPVRIAVELSARLHRELIAYAVAINGGETKGAPTVERIVAPMLERFVASDREFAKVRKTFIRREQQVSVASPPRQQSPTRYKQIHQSRAGRFAAILPVQGCRDVVQPKNSNIQNGKGKSIHGKRSLIDYNAIA